ncbi:MAG: 4-alpha-glucanotransferase, partial [Bryobacteraceae bacterium]
PDKAWSPESLYGNGKAAGIAVSLYGLRSGRNWGCGDFTDLRDFIDWTAEHLQAGFVALNPLHAIPNRQPYNTSPYLPTSMFYRNPLYLDVTKVEDFPRSRWAQRLLERKRVQDAISELRSAKYVEYEKVYALKLPFLKLAFRAFLQEQRRSSPHAQEFHRYIDTEGELLHRFAVYCALDEIIHKRHPDIWIWPDWPEQYRDPESEAVSSFAHEHSRLVLFYKYIQWQVDLQLAAAQQHAKNRGLSIGLYHDLALATDRCGSDLWAHRPFYVSGCRVGSPPDDFSPSGQDWGFPPPNSVKHRDDGYQLFSASIRKNARHGGALRIDHVMRFFRLFWIPDGRSAVEGTYVKDYPDDLLRILALESVRNRFIVIGEDLGTVEPAFREDLERFGILSYRLLYFEKNSSGDFKLPQEYPRKALVSVSTHDLPTLAGFWTGRDIEARRNAGLVDEASYHQQRASRIEEKQKLLNLFFYLNLLPDWFPRIAAEIAEFTGELHYAAVGFLASTPSELMVLNQEDLFKDTDQQNLPGSTEQYPNWRHKLRFTIEEMNALREVEDYARMFRHWLERAGRL